MTATTRVLIFCPRFFSYHEAVLAAARRMGMVADWIDDRGSATWPYKIGLKVLPGVTRAVTQRPIRRALASVTRPQDVDHILVIKGDGLSRDTVDYIRRLAPRATMTLYLWDNIRNIRGGVGHLVGAFDRVLSFDPDDAAAHDWEFLPNFCRAPLSAPQAPGRDSYDWSFIGSLHSDRHRVLRGLIRENPQSRYFVHCYAQNGVAGFLRSYRDPMYLAARTPPIAHQIMPAEDAWSISQRSRAVVDIEHPSQNGLTMRTLETILDGRKLVTTNEHLREYDLYDPSRVAIIDRRKPAIDAQFFTFPFKPLDPAVAEKYVVDAWLKYALGLAPNPHELPPRIAADLPSRTR